MIKMSAIKKSYLTPKGQTLRAQVIELQKFKYYKIHKGDPRIVSDKWFDENVLPLLYKYKCKLLNEIAYDILVHGINRMSGKTRAPLGNKFMNLYCALSQRYPATTRLLSAKLNGPAWKKI